MTSSWAVDVSNNHLVGTIPGAWGSSTTLTSLDVSHNDLTGIIKQTCTQEFGPVSAAVQ